MAIDFATPVISPFAPAAKRSQAFEREFEASVPGSGDLAFRLKNIVKSFDGKRVLKGIDLDVRRGEFVAVIGKSGCGKSTLLRILAGLEKPTSGTIQNFSKERTRIMFQEPRLLPWGKIGDNVAVGLTGISKGKSAKEQAHALLEEVGLEDRAGEWPYVLSGGQKQRVALARALVARPELLALDEPLGALDALTRIEMHQLIERIWRKQKFAAVLVTHDVAEAVALADRIVVIDEGRIALDLTVDLPRPRRHATPAAAEIEAKVLESLFGKSQA